MKKNILSMAALLIASAAVFTACSSDDNISSEQPANPTGKYTMTVQASKDGDATTRALTLGRNDANTKNVLNATWNENEEVLVYQGGSQIGTLYSAVSTTNATTLTGTLDSAPDADKDLTLYFHTNATPNYDGQDGTLAKIASDYDFCAPATIAKDNFTVSGYTVSTTSSVSFGDNQQVIVKFTLKDKDSGALLNASKVTVQATVPGAIDFPATEFNIPSTTYDTNTDGVVYFAIENFPADYSAYKSMVKLEFTATVGDDTYTYTKNGWPFEDGKYYEITVKMTKQAADPTTLDNTITAWTAGTYAVPAGGLTYGNAITVSGDVTLVLTDGETLTLNKGISLAEGATLTIQGNGTMNVNGTNGNTSSTVGGNHGMLVLTSGTLNAKGGDGGSVYEDDSHGGNGGTAINGSVTVSGGTLTARGGNGGSVGSDCMGSSGGNGGDAISGTLTKNGGSTSVNDGSNGSIDDFTEECTAGTGGKGHN